MKGDVFNKFDNIYLPNNNIQCLHLIDIVFCHLDAGNIAQYLTVIFLTTIPLCLTFVFLGCANSFLILTSLFLHLMFSIV